MNNKHKCEREMSNTNTGDLFRGSSTLALRSRLQHYEGFPLKRSHMITRCRNTYNKLPQELLDPQVLTCSRKNNTRKHTSLSRSHLYKFFQYT